MSKKTGGLFVFIAILVLSAVMYWKSNMPLLTNRDEPVAKETTCHYHNINPLRCEPDTAVKKKEYSVLRHELNDYVVKNKQEGNFTNAAIYFRDLQNGPIININEQENFVPASLLKLPLLIMYYKKAETEPQLLAQKVNIEGDLDTWEQNIVPGKSVQKGVTYTVNDLLTLMITESDNVSWKLLLKYLRTNYSESDFIDTLSDLGIVDPRKQNNQQYITVQGYASIFRVLYNSSYLNPELSDKALSMLKQTTFTDGIVGGVPGNISVAHKFGEQKKGTEQQFHDCGIVYYPNNRAGTH